jgi:hypothetical protein
MGSPFDPSQTSLIKPYNLFLDCYDSKANNLARKEKSMLRTWFFSSKSNKANASTRASVSMMPPQVTLIRWAVGFIKLNSLLPNNLRVFGFKGMQIATQSACGRKL